MRSPAESAHVPVWAARSATEATSYFPPPPQVEVVVLVLWELRELVAEAGGSEGQLFKTGTCVVTPLSAGKGQSMAMWDELPQEKQPFSSFVASAERQDAPGIDGL